MLVAGQRMLGTTFRALKVTSQVATGGGICGLWLLSSICLWIRKLGSNKVVCITLRTNTLIEDVNSAFFARSVRAKLMLSCCIRCQCCKPTPLYPPSAGIYKSSFWTVYETSEAYNLYTLQRPATAICAHDHKKNHHRASVTKDPSNRRYTKPYGLHERRRMGDLSRTGR